MGSAEEARAARFRSLALPALGPIHRLARALTGEPAAAEDLVQETFLRALRYFESYRGEDMRAWLAAIMRNISHGSRTGMTIVAIEDVPEPSDPAPGPEREAIARDEAAALHRHLAALPEGLREALNLREFVGLSYAEIAAAQGVPIGTVMSRLARARARLREALAL